LGQKINKLPLVLNRHNFVTHVTQKTSHFVTESPPRSLRRFESRQFGRRRRGGELPGQLSLGDVPVQVPRLDSVTLRTVGQGRRALQVEDGETLGALGDALLAVVL
jgi:hypothetical protein